MNIKNTLKRFDEKFGSRFNIGVVPDDITKENIKQFIQEEIENAFLEGRTCKQNEIDYRVKTALNEIVPEEHDGLCYGKEEKNDQIAWNACREEIIKNINHYLAGE